MLKFNYEEEDVLLDVTMNEFPTHLPYTKNKFAPNRYVKINGQTIYNGQMSRFSRNILMHNMHSYLIGYLKGNVVNEFPVRVEFNINTVINHGNIQRRKDRKTGEYNIIWKLPKEDYEPTNDVDNLSWVWIKAFNDALKLSGCLPDDNLKYIKGYTVDFNEVETFADRSLNFKLIRVKGL